MIRRLIALMGTLDGTLGPKLAAEVCGDPEVNKLSWSETYTVAKETARVSVKTKEPKEVVDKGSEEFKAKVRAYAEARGTLDQLPADY
jgi:hypothetical protein